MADDERQKKYAVPIYGVAWVPHCAIRSASKQMPDGDGGSKDTADDPSSLPAHNYVALAGGGGEGRSGIPNAILLVQVDFNSYLLSDQPVARLGTGTDLPYRIAAHPGGEGLICSFPENCRWFEWDAIKKSDDSALTLKSSERVLKHLEDIGQQLALTFNSEGSLLAVGGENGKLRVFKWPSMEIIIDEMDDDSVKDLDFSPDGKFLASVGSGCCRVWNVSTLASVISLQKKDDEKFGFCRFSRSSDHNQTIYVTATRAQGGSIVEWSTSSWERMRSKLVAGEPISAFNVSADGKLLAIGTSEGNVRILRAGNMGALKTIKKAHIGPTTALAFSDDSRALLSVSMDSSARVTLITDNGSKNGLSLWIILFVILLAMAVYYAKHEGKLPWLPDFLVKL
ncbi:unnamed protein product [Cuscuta campestris]|uniref:Anaphase-promoting complex subunit 4 WD40 domain-containing protein n=1 Tax=Cuscuta campestris TaxID=132261 RepID=A0A484KFE4_9ASTE|nr:unnamed protein product [Cuscuta campestris]